MKRAILALIITISFISAHAGVVQLYLGARGGVGDQIIYNHFDGVPVSSGSVNYVTHTNSMAAHFKAEALLGLWRFRLGYRFMYNFASPNLSGGSQYEVTNNQNTTYFNASHIQLFAHYFVAEIAVVNFKHFGLVPGLAVGSYTGFSTDNGTNAKVALGDDTYHRFTIGAELNFEIKFGRLTILLGPNYYMFAMQDRTYSGWNRYQHYIGADAGIRINLLKP